MDRTQAVLFVLFNKPLLDVTEALTKGYRVIASAILLRLLATLQMYENGAIAIVARRSQPKAIHFVNISDHIRTLENIHSACSRRYNGEYLFTDAEILFVLIEFFGRVVGTASEETQ